MPPVRIGRIRIGESPKLVAIITEPHVASQFARARNAGADFAELRLDYLSHWPEEKIIRAVKRASHAGEIPLIATLRTPREGGARRDGVLADEKRREALFKSLMPHVHAVDIELSSSIAGNVAAAAHKQGIPAILSYHHFRSTPSLTRLRALAQLCKAKGGDIAKIVTTAVAPIDLIRLLSLLHERPCHPLAAFAMGRHALLSRLAAFFFQSSLLYGTLPGQRLSPAPAPGVPTLTELTDAFRQFRLKK
jgi:3-dehydroquinate dehydratase-1